jgi:cell wall-associated NlpC family hydrolase
MPARHLPALLLIIATALPAASHVRGAAPLPVPAHGVVGVHETHLSPDFWIGRLADPDRVLMDPVAIAAQNARLVAREDSMLDLRALPSRLSRDDVHARIRDLSSRPSTARFDVEGGALAESDWTGLEESLALDAIPASIEPRFGLVVARADLRTYPTTRRVFSRQGDSDIDRFQESALFPGTPVAVLHTSSDGDWLFVASPRYQAWIERRFVAEGPRAAVFGYLDRARAAPRRVVTGGKVHTVFTPEAPRVSDLQLEMGVAVPLADVQPDRLVNGQHPYTSWIVELPVREADGSLAFSPALLPRIEDTAADVLPLTPANLVRQGFKFLGERYGWGHSYDARDCSGFVSEVYRSMGVQLPRNTSDQGTTDAFSRTAFDADSTVEARMAAVEALEVGDLVYIPGHVMMVIGRVDGHPYVIHDTNGGSMRGADGRVRSLGLNGVVVTALLPMMFNDSARYVDRMTAIVSPHRALPSLPHAQDGTQP